MNNLMSTVMYIYINSVIQVPYVSHYYSVLLKNSQIVILIAKKMTPPLSHDENRYKVCFLCVRKEKTMFRITTNEALLSDLKSVMENYVDEHWLPGGLCTTCRSVVWTAKNQAKQLTPPDLSKFKAFKQTRKYCECELCKIARCTHPNFAGTCGRAKKSPITRRCEKCFNLLERGKPHPCSPTTRLENLVKITSESSPKEQDHIVSKIVKEKCEGTSSLQLSQSHGRSLKISVQNHTSSHTSSRPVLSAEDMISIKTTLNLSDRDVLKLGRSLRSGSKNRKIIEPGLISKLYAKSHTVDKFFSYSRFTFTNSKKNIVSETPVVVVHCNNVNGFVDHVKSQRNVRDNYHLKLGVDGGGDFLKICLSVQSKSNNASKPKRSKYSYSDGISPKQFQDSGVKRLFILAAVANSQENYENIKELWITLNLNPFSGTIATDFKLANILAGIMAHSSMYPCTYCYANKDNLNNCGDLRTSANVLANYEKWMTQGNGDKKLAKNFLSCVHPPLITTMEGQTFLDVIPPPELHLMLGIVNTTFNHMLKYYPSDAEAWANQCHVQREITHGSSGFKGNACKTLLEKVDILSSSKNEALQKYVKVFSDFKDVVAACFGSNLNDDYKICIDKFKESYTASGVSITPKAHAVFFHVKQFCEKTGMALGFFSEQAMESVHYDFKMAWVSEKVKEDHPDYPETLLNAIRRYNALHV